MAEASEQVRRKDEFATLASLIDSLDRGGDMPALCLLHKRDMAEVRRAALREQVRQTAMALRQIGLERGDAVILWDDNSPEWIIACLAVIRAGGRIVPLDVQIGRASLERIIENCTPHCLLTGARRLERLDELSCDTPRVLLLERGGEEGESLWDLSAEGELPELAEEDEAALFYTSGTTGPPKGVPLTHGNLIFQVNRILRTGLIRTDDRLLLPLPLHHVYPFVMGMLLPLAAQIPVILPQAMTGPQIVRALQEGRATVVCGVPRLHRALHDTIIERLAARGATVVRLFRQLMRLSLRIRCRTGWNVGRLLFKPLHRRIGPDLRMMASGGSSLDPELARFFAGLGWDVVIGYGLTETAPLLTINPPGSGRYDSVGRAIDGVELKLDHGKSDSADEGEVLARGPNIFAGYYRMPDETETSFTADGWFRTGDLGTLDADGFLRIRGRVSTLIVTESGKNIRPEEVEDAYEESPLVKEIGVLDDEGRLVALVVPAEGDDGEQLGRGRIEAALAEVADHLPSYWRLSGFSLTGQALPRTRLGKLRRHLLAERYRAAREGEERVGQQDGAPLALEEMSGEDRNLLENRAARSVWDWLADRYDDRGLTPDSRLQSDLGIDSLEWLTVTVEVGERTGIELGEEAIAGIRTVRDLLEAVASGSEEGESRFAGEPLKNPEKVLSREQARWLDAPGPVRSRLQSLIFRLTRLFMRRYFDLEVTGLDNLPQGPCVFAPNHLSSLDPPAIAAILPREVLAKTWWGGWTGIAFRNPLTRALSRLGNLVPIDPHRAVQSSLAFGAAVLRDQRCLVWVPEGRRSPGGELQEFKAGLGLLLDRYPTPVLPIMIEGTGRLLPIGRLWPRRGSIRIVIGEPRDPRALGGDRQSPQEKARAIVEALREDLRRLQEDS